MELVESYYHRRRVLPEHEPAAGTPRLQHMLLKSEVEAGIQAVRLKIVYHIHPPYHCLRQVYPHKAPFSTPTARGAVQGDKGAVADLRVYAYNSLNGIIFCRPRICGGFVWGEDRVYDGNGASGHLNTVFRCPF